MRSPSALLAAAAAALVLLAGCVAPADITDSAGGSPELPVDPPVLPLEGLMGFATSVVTPAMHFALGLYEPTIDVSGSGILYISAHTIGVDTTGAPAFYSADDGVTWRQLPFLATLAVPEPLHGGTPPPSDEIFIVAGDDGQAWGVDITLATFPVNGWCSDGAEHCYHNPNAYERSATANDCSALSLNDRPWAAYAAGKLLLVNNPGTGVMQIAAMDVPPALPAGLATPATGPQWNMCASTDGYIPGIPAMRPDHFFAAPHVKDDRLVIITGNAADVMTVEEREVFTNLDHTPASQISNYGQVAFDAEGTMYVVAMSNEEAEAGPGAGGIRLAVSTDDGLTFTERTYRFDAPVTSLYIDGNTWGPGAIINWGLLDGEATDWYVGHLVRSATGEPVVREATLAVDDGPEASRHVQGAAVGPDGRAYLVLSHVSGNDQQQSVSQTGSTPLFVVVQQEGPRLPVTAPAAAPEEEGRAGR